MGRQDDLPGVQYKMTPGVQRKPDWCYANCAYAKVGSGIAFDEWPKAPKIAVLLEAPGGDEIVHGRPLMGVAGKSWEWNLLFPLKKCRADVGICNTLRCRPPHNGYPTGTLRREAERCCRHWDSVEQGGDRCIGPGGIVKFNPDLFLITEHPAAILHSGALGKMRLIRKHMERAFRFADQGARPCVLMGRTAMDLIAPELSRASDELHRGKKGGLTKWFGHFWEGGWGFDKES